jgi:hypothetical protein
MEESIIDVLKRVRERLERLISEGETLPRKNALDKLESAIAWLEGELA